VASADDERAASGQDATMAAASRPLASNPTADTVAPESGAAGEDADALPLGARRYALGRELGRGGMGQVLEAEDLQFGRKVAVKRLGPDAKPESRARFLTEAQVTAGLGHPGVPGVMERGRLADGSPFYAMQKVQGRTLTRALAEAGSAEERLSLLPALSRVAQTIAFAHEQGVVHRDLKPDNIILGEFGQTVVLDWGLAKLAKTTVGQRVAAGGSGSGSAELTMDGAVLGTPAYMAPEQADGRLDAMDARTDVFGLGALLYQILTGKAPFAASSSAEAVLKASEADYAPVASLHRSAPKRLVEICDKAMARRPDDRYGSAREFSEALESFTAQAVSSGVDRIANVVSAGIGTASILGLFAVDWFIIETVGFGSLDINTLVAIGLTTIGVSASIVEWKARGRYRLGPFSLALALATGALGVAGWAAGVSQLNETLLQGGLDPLEFEKFRHKAGYVVHNALAVNGYLCALQLILWGVVRRRAQR
jgi:hypothetical protein